MIMDTVTEEQIEVTSVPSEVKLIKTWGGDSDVADAAVVHDPDDEYMDFDHVSRLVDGLGAEGHWGCFEHSGATLLVRVPIFTARQVIRHRTGAFNEYSLRYKRMLPRFYVPKNMLTDVKRVNLGDEPQLHERSDEWKEKIVASYATVWRLYQDMLADGVRKEQARTVLPFGSFTEFWMTMSLRNWMHFLNLRVDSHAQLEARDLGDKVLAMLTAYFPVSMSVWDRYGRGGVNGRTIQTP